MTPITRLRRIMSLSDDVKVAVSFRPKWQTLDTHFLGDLKCNSSKYQLFQPVVCQHINMEVLVMRSRYIRVSNMLALAAAVLVAGTIAPRFAANGADAELHNTVICIKTKDKAPLFIDLPHHCDLGSPSISPDGKTIALDAISLVDVITREAWLVGTDGTGLRKLADGGSPRWSPDGKRIMLSRDKPGSARPGTASRSLIEIVQESGKEHDRGDGRYPDWSPDGKQLAFSDQGERARGNTGIHYGAKIFIAKPDGDERMELVEGSWPSWSPDGKKIAYHKIEEGVPNFYVIDLATKKQVKIGVGFFRALGPPTARSFVSNTVVPVGGEMHRLPAVFNLDTPEKPEVILSEFDTPFSPCLSRDGKTMAFIVDSHKIAEQPPKTEK